jgi:hypothetical protein
MIAVKFPDFVGEKQGLTKALERIARAIVERRSDFLFGAGMSSPPPSNVPTGRDLAVKLLEHFFSADVAPQLIEHFADTVPFECIAQAVESLPGKKRKDLTPFLRQLLVDSDPPINAAHNNFLSVFDWDGQRRLRRIYTTNFDKLLEKALAGRGVTVTEKNAHEIDTIADEKVPVLHLHGTLDDDDYQITESDLFCDRFRKLHSRFETTLRETDAFVFVGYSMTDPDFRRIYLRYQNDIQSRREDRKDSYVVAPPSNPEQYDLGKVIWASRGAIWLPLDAESFFGAIKNVLESKTTKDIEEDIMEKYHLRDRDAYREKVEQAMKILEISEADAIEFLYQTRPKTG